VNGDETIQKLSATFGVRRHVAALQSADMSAHSKGAAGDYDRVIMRALGPELTNFGVPKALTNPTLELHNSAGTVIASKYNWQQTIIGGIITSNQVSEIMATGSASADGRESAIVAELLPGNYTAIVRGVDNTTGVGLVEVYDLH